MQCIICNMFGTLYKSYYNFLYFFITLKKSASYARPEATGWTTADTSTSSDESDSSSMTSSFDTANDEQFTSPSNRRTAMKKLALGSRHHKSAFQPSKQRLKTVRPAKHTSKISESDQFSRANEIPKREQKITESGMEARASSDSGQVLEKSVLAQPSAAQLQSVSMAVASGVRSSQTNAELPKPATVSQRPKLVGKSNARSSASHEKKKRKKYDAKPWQKKQNSCNRETGVLQRQRQGCKKRGEKPADELGKQSGRVGGIAGKAEKRHYWVPSPEAKELLDKVCITDVTSDLVTVTVKECTTDKGFFTATVV